MQRQASDRHGTVRFLKHLLHQIPGKLLVIWDGLPAHRGEAVRSFLATGAAARLQLERLPGYAPELNPVDGLWQYLKNVELRNLCFPGFSWLMASPALSAACVTRPRLSPVSSATPVTTFSCPRSGQ